MDDAERARSLADGYWEDLLALEPMLGTMIGVLAGNLIGDPNKLGLDAAFPALFLALLVGQIRSRRAALAAAAGGTIALVVTPFAKPGVPLIVACLACLIGWRRTPDAGRGWAPADTIAEELP